MIIHSYGNNRRAIEHWCKLTSHGQCDEATHHGADSREQQQTHVFGDLPWLQTWFTCRVESDCSYGPLPVLSTYNPIYRMYNLFYSQL